MLIKKYSIVYESKIKYTNVTTIKQKGDNYMKKKIVAIMMMAVLTLSMTACGGEDSSNGGTQSAGSGDSGTTSSDVANKDKPLCWFNRQPS